MITGFKFKIVMKAIDKIVLSYSLQEQALNFDEIFNVYCNI